MFEGNARITKNLLKRFVAVFTSSIVTMESPDPVSLGSDPSFEVLEF